MVFHNGVDFRDMQPALAMGAGHVAVYLHQYPIRPLGCRVSIINRTAHAEIAVFIHGRNHTGDNIPVAQGSPAQRGIGKLYGRIGVDALMNSRAHPGPHKTTVYLNMITVLQIPDRRGIEVQRGKEGNVLKFFRPPGQGIQYLPGMAAGNRSNYTIPVAYQPHRLFGRAQLLLVLIAKIQP